MNFMFVGIGVPRPLPRSFSLDLSERTSNIEESRPSSLVGCNIKAEGVTTQVDVFAEFFCGL